MLFPIISLLVLHVFLPAYLIYSLLNNDDDNQFDWLLVVLMGAALTTFLALAGRWDWFSRYLRFVPLALFAAAVVYTYPRVRERPFFTNHSLKQWLTNTVWLVLEALIAVVLVVFAARGYARPDDPVSLSFPLENGDYYVGQGGSSTLVNYHHPSPSQAYAADITELNALGIRADGIYPNDPAAYTIYGATVISPCEGTVTAVENDQPDQNPPQSDPEHPAGNHVMITCEGVSVMLAHMQRGSVTVEMDEHVTTGQPLGKVGNSGNTSEPHLHIHAVEGQPEDILGGEAVPIVFDGRFPTRNTVFRR